MSTQFHKPKAGLFALVALGALAACGSSQVAASADPRADAGCPTAAAVSTEELYVSAMYACGSNSLYEFASGAARDSWSAIATQAGSVTLNSGPNWLLVK